MNIRLNVFIFFTLLSNSAFAIEVIEPQELQTSLFKISDPDRFIRTLGKVSFAIDLSASHDDLLALKVRRSSLTLKDGRGFKSFGVHKEAGLIIIAGADVSHISIASVKGSNASVLFYGANNQIIAPHPNDIAVFDMDFKPVDFSYTPLKTPSSLTIPITIALDTSGSMAGHMDKVIKATKTFMKSLPDFMRCNLIAFNNDIKYLSPRDIHAQRSCSASTYLLNAPLKAEGATSLYKAIDAGFSSHPVLSKDAFPNIVIVITDGKNTVDYKWDLNWLGIRKRISHTKLFVFWAGNYTKGYMQGLADLEFVSTKNLDNELEQFFTSLGVSLSGLQTVQIRK